MRCHATRRRRARLDVNAHTPERMFASLSDAAGKSALGLGLSICRNSVEANGGLLRVRDVPGTGCVFTIDLPRHAP